MELPQLEAFVAVATELHFGRAAERLHLAAPTLSELLARSKSVLDEVAADDAAVRRVAGGEAGTVRLGTTPADLFPGWALSQRQALEQAGISPPTIDLADTDLTATRWAEQQDIDWILLIPSLAAAHTTTVIRPTSPAQLVPFTLQWNPNRAHHGGRPVRPRCAYRRAAARLAHPAGSSAPPARPDAVEPGH